MQKRKMTKRPRDPDFKHWVDGGNDSNGNELTCRDLNDRLVYTPDFPQLRKYALTPVFIYDNMMLGQSSHYQIAGGTYYGKAHTMTDFFEMRSLGHSPVVMSSDKSKDSKFAYVRGQVWGLDVERVHILDEFMKNGFEYQRMIKPVFLEDQGQYNFEHGGHSYLKCHMYIGLQSYWKDRNTSTHPTKIYRTHVSERMKDRPFFEWDAPQSVLNFGRQQNPQNNNQNLPWHGGYPGMMDDDDERSYGGWVM